MCISVFWTDFRREHGSFGSTNLGSYCSSIERDNFSPTYSVRAQAFSIPVLRFYTNWNMKVKRLCDAMWTAPLKLSGLWPLFLDYSKKFFYKGKLFFCWLSWHVDRLLFVFIWCFNNCRKQQLQLLKNLV